jgi:hypothetical protein
VEGSCEHGIEPLGSIKCWEVLEGLHNWRLLKKGWVGLRAGLDDLEERKFLAVWSSRP